MIDVVVFLVFVLALTLFLLYPAIYLIEKLSERNNFIAKNSTKFSIFLALIFSVIATNFVFSF